MLIVDEALKALVEPRRREIMRLLALSEMSSGEVASHFDVTGPAISQHLGVLVKAELVTVRREGRRRLYRAVPSGIEEVREYLAGFWATGLERVEAEAEAEERRRTDASAN